MRHQAIKSAGYNALYLAQMQLNQLFSQKMKTLLTPALLFLLTLSTLAADENKTDVAKVDYGEIDDLLTQVVLNVEGNEELRDRYNATQKSAQAAQEKMQAAILKGEKIDPMEAASEFMRNRPDDKKVERLCQKHLLEIIERVFDGRYSIIFKDDYRSSLLFTKTAIDDVTSIIKQELLKELPKN